MCIGRLYSTLAIINYNFISEVKGTRHVEQALTHIIYATAIQYGKHMYSGAVYTYSAQEGRRYSG